MAPRTRAVVDAKRGKRVTHQRRLEVAGGLIRALYEDVGMSTTELAFLYDVSPAVMRAFLKGLRDIAMRTPVEGGRKYRERAKAERYLLTDKQRRRRYKSGRKRVKAVECSACHLPQGICECTAEQIAERSEDIMYKVPQRIIV